VIRVTFKPLAVGEIRKETFSFLSALAVGETISTQSVVASVYSGTDATPSDLVSGSASASGAVVTQALDGTAAVLGVIYHLVCTITTSASQTLQAGGYLAVVPDTP
jgi:hypothetical protein